MLPLKRNDSLFDVVLPGPAQQDFEWGGSSVSQIFFVGGGGGGGERRNAILGKLGF